MASERLPRLAAAGTALLAGLALRLWFVHHAPVLAGDGVIYTTIARNLLLHGVYGFNQHTGAAGLIVFEPTLIRLPGYPLFIALVFRLFGVDNVRAILYLQVAADLLTCLLTAATARRLFGRAAALAVLFLAALCPFTANYTAVPLTEPLVLLTIALAFYALLRWTERDGGWNPWLWVLAAALAASILLRPEQGLLAAAILPAMLWFQLRIVYRNQETLIRLSQAKDPLPNHHLTAKNDSVVLTPSCAKGEDALRQNTNPPERKSSVILSEARSAKSKDLLLYRNAWRVAAPILAAALFTLLPLIPWTARNWYTFHTLQPLAPKSATDPGEPPSPGFNHWYRTWGLDFTTTDTVYWNIDGDPILSADLPNRAFARGCTAPAGVPRQRLPLYAETVALLADYNRTTLDPPALDARFEALARRRAVAEPLCNHLLLPLGRLANMLLRPRVEILPIADEWWDPATPLRRRLFALAYAALNLAYLVLAVCGLTRWVRCLRCLSIERSGAPFTAQPHRAGGVEAQKLEAATVLLAATLATVALRLGLLLTLDNSEPRYTLELFPILFLWSVTLFTIHRGHAEPRCGHRAL